MNPLRATEALFEVTWRKASRSASNAHCVEVAVTDQLVGVRDTKDRDSGTLAFSRNAWSAFTNSVKADGLTR